MNYNINFTYEDDASTAIITYKGRKFTGIAICHPTDKDFSSERVGCCIAEARAYIKLLKFKKECEIKPKKDILTHLYHNMESSTHFNPKSYEGRMVRHQLKAVENELNTVSQEIAEEEKFLTEYIANKEKLYQRLRAKSNNQ